MANRITKRSSFQVARRVGRAPDHVTGRLTEAGKRRARSIAPPTVDLLMAAGVGAVAQYFVDRHHGARRRHLARNRARASLWRRSREAVRGAKYLVNERRGRDGAPP